MKKHILFSITLLAFMLSFLSCQKEEDTPKTPKVTEEYIGVSATAVTFTWTVDWLGKFASIVEVSENEDMSNSQTFGSETESDNYSFTATATGMEEAAVYYYRYLIWNQNYVDNKFKTEVKRVVPTGPIGSINGLFSVSDSVQVYFSKGNLQYNGTTNTWKFADRPWDLIGTDQDNSSQNTIRDLFGWGTSGWNCGNLYYRPYDTNVSDGSQYGPLGNNNLIGSYADSDWGVYNAICNGGNQAGLWRTLTREEWAYVFNTREGTWLNGVANARYAKAEVNDTAGVILFPDSYDHPSGVPEPNNINKATASYVSNVYSVDDWNLMEQVGCVFLPAAGFRHGTSAYSVGFKGYYWSASYANNIGAYGVGFFDSDLDLEGSGFRNSGRSVRLVCNAQ